MSISKAGRIGLIMGLVVLGSWFSLGTTDAVVSLDENIAANTIGGANCCWKTPAVTNECGSHCSEWGIFIECDAITGDGKEDCSEMNDDRCGDCENSSSLNWGTGQSCTAD